MRFRGSGSISKTKRLREGEGTIRCFHAKAALLFRGRRIFRKSRAVAMNEGGKSAFPLAC